MEQPIQTPQPPEQPKSPERLIFNIIVAEDDPQLRYMYEAMITRQGHKVTMVENGNLLMQELSKPGANFDLVLTDNNMPEKTGLQALREIRASSGPFKNIKVILATTDHGIIEAETKALGATFLHKPFNYADLENTINIISESIKEKR